MKLPESGQQLASGAVLPPTQPHPPMPPPTSAGRTVRPSYAALDAAIRGDDVALQGILDTLLPDELYRLANAASRLRRACEQVHNGAPGEAAHHGRTRWEFGG